MKQLLLVFLGGGAGSVLRFLIGKQFNNTQTGIPYGTFAANILGSFLIGLILGYALKNNSLSQNQTLLLATGFCGGFTTFSTFAYENHIFLKSGDFLTFAIYTIASFVLGFLAVFLGMFLVK
ncbi:fluoride efflux transporter CrcB [Neotamlana laminarinivorans]|uniref:Fluoride-specific ion channel FluC n=1 Tax=Neotamlana laminarinivorans TaxID=2883124 RepID=A0A9X1HZB6_9FLAO|nr:fluoride efflux transporter CrcB [Tamlana laminarinivorans]MCB4798919.1 fluoride efflux transporter CrcB [Tamlana laminarinivorans]